MSHLNQNKKILNRIRRIQGQTNALEQNILNSDKNMTLETILKSSSTLDDIQGFEQDVTYWNYSGSSFKKSFG